jgi:hypothetical protein
VFNDSKTNKHANIPKVINNVRPLNNQQANQLLNNTSVIKAAAINVNNSTKMLKSINGVKKQNISMNSLISNNATLTDNIIKNATQMTIAAHNIGSVATDASVINAANKVMIQANKITEQVGPVTNTSLSKLATLSQNVANLSKVITKAHSQVYTAQGNLKNVQINKNGRGFFNVNTLKFNILPKSRTNQINTPKSTNKKTNRKHITQGELKNIYSNNKGRNYVKSNGSNGPSKQYLFSGQMI